MRVSVASFALRRSTVMRTSPGTTLREFGFTCMWPTVPRALSGYSRAMRLTSSTRRLAAISASLRRFMGVGPACESWPVSTTSNQRWPSAPCTTPMVVFVSSSTGPCSMCASK